MANLCKSTSIITYFDFGPSYAHINSNLATHEDQFKTQYFFELSALFDLENLL